MKTHFLIVKCISGSLEEDNEPKLFKLKPSILTEVAKNLTVVTSTGEPNDELTQTKKLYQVLITAILL
jgi:hypothetical protein